MAGESIGCAARKKSKTKNSDKSQKNDNNGGGGGGGDLTKEPPITQTTRGGLRVYKIVILGDGGVGKSGERNSIWFDSFAIKFNYEIVSFLVWWHFPLFYSFRSKKNISEKFTLETFLFVPAFNGKNANNEKILLIFPSECIYIFVMPTHFIRR